MRMETPALMKMPSWVFKLAVLLRIVSSADPSTRMPPTEEFALAELLLTVFPAEFPDSRIPAAPFRFTLLLLIAHPAPASISKPSLVFDQTALPVRVFVSDPLIR